MLPQQQPELLWIVTDRRRSQLQLQQHGEQLNTCAARVAPQRHDWTPGGSSLSCGPCGGGEHAAGHGGGLLACHWQCWHHWQLLVAVVQNKNKSMLLQIAMIALVLR